MPWRVMTGGGHGSTTLESKSPGAAGQAWPRTIFLWCCVMSAPRGSTPSTGRHRRGSAAHLNRFTKILLRNDALFHCPDHESPVARQVPQVIFAPCALLKLPENPKAS